MNQTYKISVKSPLLRAGLEIEVDVSAKYAVPAVRELMNIVREINAGGDPNPVQQLSLDPRLRTLLGD